MRRAQRLLEDRPSLAFGVARRQLIVEGVTTIPSTRSSGAWQRNCTAITSVRSASVEAFRRPS